MIYCQLRARAYVDVQHTLTLGDVATTLSSRAVDQLPVCCPKRPGVWKIDAVEAAGALQKACPGEDVTMLGPPTCCVHRVHANRPDRFRWLRAAAAFLILMLGSALGLAWFHSDVDMPEAQRMVFRLITGQEVTDERFITIPYVVGVALGVVVFYALPGRKATTPLEVKLDQFRSDMEQTEGKDPHGSA